MTTKQLHFDLCFVLVWLCKASRILKALPKCNRGKPGSVLAVLVIKMTSFAGIRERLTITCSSHTRDAPSKPAPNCWETLQSRFWMGCCGLQRETESKEAPSAISVTSSQLLALYWIMANNRLNGPVTSS